MLFSQRYNLANKCLYTGKVAFHILFCYINKIIIVAALPECKDIREQGALFFRQRAFLDIVEIE